MTFRIKIKIVVYHEVATVVQN